LVARDRFRVDPALVQRARAELPYRTRAFEALAKQAYPFVRRISVGIVGDPGDAENVTQEVMLRIFRGLPGFERRSNFESWLLSIVYNTARNHLRDRRRDHVLVPMEEAGEPAGGHDPAAAASGDFERMIANLDAAERAIITLRFREGFELQEISEALDLGLSATKMRLYRALEKLRADPAVGGAGR